LQGDKAGIPDLMLGRKLSEDPFTRFAGLPSFCNEGCRVAAGAVSAACRPGSEEDDLYNAKKIYKKKADDFLKERPGSEEDAPYYKVYKKKADDFEGVP
tara:strand:+ start:214 stop:510 length:297 start_codon:yes stop_codon:yes gene_type:complete